MLSGKRVRVAVSCLLRLGGAASRGKVPLCRCGAQRKDIPSPFVVLEASCCGFSFICLVMLTTGCVARSVMEVAVGFPVVLILERRVEQGCQHFF